MTTNYIKKMDAVKVSVSEIKAKLALVKKIGAVESKDSSQPSSHIVVMKEGAGLKILSGLNFIHEIFMTCENDVSHYEDGAILWGANFKELEYSINVICKANKNEELFIYTENDFSYIETISGSVKKFAMFDYECVIENRQRFTNAYTCVGEINAGYFKNMPKDSIFLTLYPYSKEVFLGNTKSFVSFKTSSLDGIDVEDMLGYKLHGYKKSFLNKVVKAIKNNGLKIYKIKKEHKDYSSYEYCNYVAFAGGIDIRLERGINFKAIKQGTLVTKITFTNEDIHALEKMAGKINNNVYILYEDNSLILKEVGINGESFEYDLRDCKVSNKFGVELGLKVDLLKDLLKESDTIEFYDNKQAVNGIGSVAVMLDAHMNREYPNPYYNQKPSEYNRKFIEDTIKVSYDSMIPEDKSALYELNQNAKAGNSKEALKQYLSKTNIHLLSWLNTYNQKWVFEYFVGLVSNFDVSTSFAEEELQDAKAKVFAKMEHNYNSLNARGWEIDITSMAETKAELEKMDMLLIVYSFGSYIDREYPILTKLFYLYKDVLSFYDRFEDDTIGTKINDLIYKDKLSLGNFITKVRDLYKNEAYSFSTIDSIAINVLLNELEYTFYDMLGVSFDTFIAYENELDKRGYKYTASSKENWNERVAYDKNNNQISGDLNKDKELMDILLNRVSKDAECENIEGKAESNLTTNYGIAYLGGAYKRANVCYAMSI